jgi:hypothetical protein
MVIESKFLLIVMVLTILIILFLVCVLQCVDDKLS